MKNKTRDITVLPSVALLVKNAFRRSREGARHGRGVA